MALLFVNTRAQAELLFQELWRINEDTLAIALHHGSLAKEQRRKVEAAMASGARTAPPKPAGSSASRRSARVALCQDSALIAGVGRTTRPPYG